MIVFRFVLETHNCIRYVLCVFKDGTTLYHSVLLDWNINNP